MGYAGRQQRYRKVEGKRLHWIPPWSLQLIQNFHFGTQVAASIHLIASFATVKSDDFRSLGASVPPVRLKGAILPLPCTGTRQ